MTETTTRPRRLVRRPPPVRDPQQVTVTKFRNGPRSAWHIVERSVGYPVLSFDPLEPDPPGEPGYVAVCSPTTSGELPSAVVTGTSAEVLRDRRVCRTCLLLLGLVDRPRCAGLRDDGEPCQSLLPTASPERLCRAHRWQNDQAAVRARLLHSTQVIERLVSTLDVVGGSS